MDLSNSSSVPCAVYMYDSLRINALSVGLGYLDYGMPLCNRLKLFASAETDAVDAAGRTLTHSAIPVNC